MDGESDKLKHVGTQSKETVDLAAAKAQDAVNWTLKSTGAAMDKLSDKVDDAKSGIAGTIDQVASAASVMADKAKNQYQSVRGQVRAQASSVSDKVADYTQEDSVKAMLIAAATGALLMGLVSMIARSRD